MVIKDLLVHLDQTPVAQKRLDAALTLGQHFNAHVTALYLIAEPFVRGAVGYHLPDEVAREHLRHAQAEADTVFTAAREAADSRGVVLETRLEAGALDRLPVILARTARNAGAWQSVGDGVWSGISAADSLALPQWQPLGQACASRSSSGLSVTTTM